MDFRPTRRITAMVASGAAVTAFVLLSPAGADAARLITGNDIQDNSITSADIKDGRLRAEDFKAGQLPAGAEGAPGMAGATGAVGPTGATGATGPAGIKGDTGQTGPAGAIGAAGPTGPAGDIGPQGGVGPQGDIGAPGTPGTPGAPGTPGVQGPAGSVGPAGTVGPAGPAGPAGSAGESAPQPRVATWTVEHRADGDADITAVSNEAIPGLTNIRSVDFQIDGDLSVCTNGLGRPVISLASGSSRILARSEFTNRSRELNDDNVSRGGSSPLRFTVLCADASFTPIPLPDFTISFTFAMTDQSRPGEAWK